jgi:hypothetical protein
MKKVKPGKSNEKKDNLETVKKKKSKTCNL